MDDHALVQAVLDGDREAFRALVEREQVAVYRVCLRILGRPQDAEDCAQEAFVLAYRSLGSYRGDGPLGGWLMRIAVRQAYRRRSQRRDPIALDADLGLAASDPDPLLAVLAGERERVVREAVAGLTDPYREVVSLRYFGGLALAEIADLTRRPLNTVKTQLRRGLDRLRLDLGGEVAA